MTFAINRIDEKTLTPVERLKIDERSGRLTPIAGSWIDDLVQLGKMVMLCPMCKGKFNPKRHQYIKWSRTWLAVAKCDGCNANGPHVTAYIPEANYEAISPDWHRPTRGRWSL